MGPLFPIGDLLFRNSFSLTFIDQWEIERAAQRYCFEDLNFIMRNELGIQESEKSSSEKLPRTKISSAEKVVDSVSIILPVTREEELNNPFQKNALVAVNKKKFPRPDLAFFSVYIPDPVLVAERQKELQARLAEGPQPAAPVVPNSNARASSPAPSLSSSFKMSTSVPTSKNTGKVPSVIQEFLAKLPLSSFYNGKSSL